MNRKQKPDLSALRQADMQMIEKISGHCPAAGKRELTKIYAASERKYQSQKHDIGAVMDSELYSVAVERHDPVWKRTWAAAACLLVCVGMFGGLYAMNRHMMPEETKTAEIDSIEDNADRTVSPEEDTDASVQIPEIVHEGQPAAPVLVEQDDAENAQNAEVSQNATVSQGGQKGTISLEAPAETDAEASESQPTEEIPVPKTESSIYHTSLSGVTFGKTYTAEDGIPEIPGFHTEVMYNDNSNHKDYWQITSVNLNGAAERIVTGLIPDYIPEYLTVKKDPEFSYERSLYNNLEDGIWQYRYETMLIPPDGSFNDEYIEVTQCVKRQMKEHVYHKDGSQITPVTIDGRPGYIRECVDSEDRKETELVWDAGDFLYIAEARNISDGFLDEMIQMLRSMQPRDKSNDSVAVNLPEIPGFTAVSEWWDDGNQNLWKITAGTTSGAPERIQTKYAATYLPEGIYPDAEESWQTIYDEWYVNHEQLGMNYRYRTSYSSVRNPKGGWLYGSRITMSQIAKNDFYNFVRFEGGSTVTPMTIGGKPGYLCRHYYADKTGSNSDDVYYLLVWDNGDYIFTIKLQEWQNDKQYFPDNWLDEIIKMAESVQPVGTAKPSPAPAASEEMTRIPGFTTEKSDDRIIITAGSMEGVTDYILTRYRPAYLPEGVSIDYEDRQNLWDSIYENHTQNGVKTFIFTTWYAPPTRADGSYIYDDYYIIFEQNDKTHFSEFIDMTDEVTPMTIDGCPGYLVTDTWQDDTTYKLVWDKGDYIYTIETSNVPADYVNELIKMAESLVPID